MEPIIIFSVFFLIVSVIWLIGTYNKFIKFKNRIEESWSGIDVALKRRFNLIPNLIRVIEGYSDHEASILISTSERKIESADTSNRVKEESQISKSLQGVLALAEAYPELKASANFIGLQNHLSEIEEDIQKVRNRYNYSVSKFNTLVESFPASLVARKFRFVKYSYFSLDLATQRELPEAQFSQSRGSRK